MLKRTKALGFELCLPPRELHLPQALRLLHEGPACPTGPAYPLEGRPQPPAGVRQRAHYQGRVTSNTDTMAHRANSWNDGIVFVMVAQGLEECHACSL
ncbi:hypothetical protein AAFF_G00182320 [Aldrovandia affinis]|uniref:Uncharacterized protein n=1 Tax=Aldrovandia affinis TaxID=143900 RepID=A0AAD7RKF7_9TELE|nr:hypothetical protein AAFF_G00182320 [Aldrovandia affinis]